jgi:hypothetical protein
MKIPNIPRFKVDFEGANTHKPAVSFARSDTGDWMRVEDVHDALIEVLAELRSWEKGLRACALPNTRVALDRPAQPA